MHFTTAIVLAFLSTLASVAALPRLNERTSIETNLPFNEECEHDFQCASGKCIVNPVRIPFLSRKWVFISFHGFSYANSDLYFSADKICSSKAIDGLGKGSLGNTVENVVTDAGGLVNDKTTDAGKTAIGAGSDVTGTVENIGKDVGQAVDNVTGGSLDLGLGNTVKDVVSGVEETGQHAVENGQDLVY
jgi:hypothetical protein